MARMEGSMLLSALFLLASFQGVKSQAGGNFFSALSRCADGPRCGARGERYSMFSGSPQTLKCNERCVLLPIFSPAFECGVCGDPTPVPLPVPSSAPSSAPSSVPSAAPGDARELVLLDRFYISFVSSSDTVSTEAQYEGLRRAIVMFYEGFFTDKFANRSDVDFVRLELNLNLTLGGVAAGIPETRYNIYTEFSGGVLQFTPSPSNPNQAVIFESMRTNTTIASLLSAVRQLTWTPFALITEGVVDRPAGPPSESPSAAPSDVIATIPVDNFYISLVSTNTTVPEEAAYERFLNLTVAYYEGFFTEKFANNPDVDFVSLDFNLDFTLEGGAVVLVVPETRFNIYMQFSDAAFQFTRSPSTPGETMILESMETAFLDSSFTTVLQLAGSPFAQAKEGQFGRLQMPSAIPSASPSESSSPSARPSTSPSLRPSSSPSSSPN